ncbi:MAG: rhodanese-like domain-containing protein [Gammaproteobacteria bacterium]|nr:rhodanese-like domain-containing protein [Gammaproteobacteria bacterium]
MKAHLITMLFATLTVVGCGGEAQTDLSGTAARFAQMVVDGEDHVTVNELTDWLIKDRRDFELVDIREQEDFTAGHIKGARHIPLATLLADKSLEDLPAAGKIVVYSNGSAHAAQAALLLRLMGRDALALLGGYNYWQAYLNDPVKAGVAEMDPVQRAQYQAVSCYFQGDYLAAAGLMPKGSGQVGAPEQVEGAAADALGLGLDLGVGEVQAMDLPGSTQAPVPEMVDELGLGFGLGGDAGELLGTPEQPNKGMTQQKLLIKAEC